MRYRSFFARVAKLISSIPPEVNASRRRGLVRIATSRSEEHTSELQSRLHLVCRLLLEKKKNNKNRSKLTAATVPFGLKAKAAKAVNLLMAIRLLPHAVVAALILGRGGGEIDVQRMLGA